jgi:hypothetical protein
VSLAVADRLALSDLVHRYAAGIDDAAVEVVAQLFTAEAELVLPNPPEVLTPVQSHRGTDAIRRALEAATQVGRTHHGLDSEVYDATTISGTARGRVAATAHHWSRREDTITDLVWYLRYDDDYVRTSAGWLLARRRLTIDAIETHPARRLR